MEQRYTRREYLQAARLDRALPILWLMLVPLLWPGAASALSISVNPLNRAGTGFSTLADDAVLGSSPVGYPPYSADARCWNNIMQSSGDLARQLKDSGNGAAYDSGVWAMWRTSIISSSSPTLSPDCITNCMMMWGSFVSTDEDNDNPLPADFFARSANQPLIYVRGLSAWLNKSGQPAGTNSYAVIVYVDGDGTDRISEYWLQRVPPASPDPPTALGLDLTTHVFVHEDGTDYPGYFTRVPLSANSEAGAATGNYILWQGMTADRFVLRTEARSSRDGFRRAVVSGLQIVAESEAVPTITISATDAAELSSNGTFTISRSGSCKNPLVVYYAVGGTATPGADYYAEDLPGSIIIPPDSASATITVRPKADGLVEGTETIIIAPAGWGQYLDGTPGAAGATLNLVDETRPPNLDADHDGDVDQADFAVFQRCYAGPEQAVTEIECLDMDIDGDGFVTGLDLEAFLGCVSGPGVAMRNDCLNHRPG